MTTESSEYVANVRMLCSVANLPVNEGELNSLSASYALITEGTESLRELDGFDESAAFTLIDPERLEDEEEAHA